MRTKHDVFICYSRETGSALAQLFCTQLEARRIDAFLDVREHYPGPFPRELRDRIFLAPCFLVLITAGCLESRWVREEIKHAFDAHRKIVVVRDATLTLPTATQNAADIQLLMNLNHIPYMHEFSDESIARAIAQIELHLGRPGRKRWAWAVVACVSVLLGLASAFALRPGAVSQEKTERVVAPPPPPQEPQFAPPMDSAGAPSPGVQIPVHTGGAAGEKANPEPKVANPPVAPPRRRYCYRLSGYEPISDRERSECRERSSKRACTEDRAIALSDSIWTDASPCEQCNCSP